MWHLRWVKSTTLKQFTGNCNQQIFLNTLTQQSRKCILCCEIYLWTYLQFYSNLYNRMLSTTNRFHLSEPECLAQNCFYIISRLSYPTHFLLTLPFSFEKNAWQSFFCLWLRAWMRSIVGLYKMTECWVRYHVPLRCTATHARNIWTCFSVNVQRI